MIDVSRETDLNENLKIFLGFLSRQEPVATWVENSSKASLKGVYGSLIPFILYLLQKKEKMSVYCAIKSDVLASSLYEYLNALCPDTVGLLIPEDIDYENDPVNTGLMPLKDQQTVNRFLLKDLSFLIVTDNVFDNLELYRLHADQSGLHVCAGKRLSPQRLIETLLAWGYERVNEVSLPGSFAVRGGIFDMFPIGISRPVRIEFIGDEVNELRFFNPLSQRMLRNGLPREITVTQPYYLKRKSEDSSQFLSVLSKESPGFFINPSGPKDIYEIVPFGQEKRGSLSSIDVLCFSHGPFKGNRVAFKEQLLYLNNKQQVMKVLFFDIFYDDYVKGDDCFKTFLTIPYPFKGSFSSFPLNLFCASLDTIDPLPKSSQPRETQEQAMDSPAVLKQIQDDLIWNSPVVHEDFGIGLYRGLSTVGSQKNKHECISIVYAGGDLVHVPFDRMDRVHAYVGSSNQPPQLSTLGSTKWERAKQQTRRSAKKVVDEFIQLYATRNKATGFHFSADSELHLDLKQSFSFEETLDQLNAYEDIKQDMEFDRPMDRLICGDVGFGKTEVALRASFKAVYDKKQVAVLTPTTILANQHFITFKSRLKPLGVRVALLSRFTPPAVKKGALTGIRDGTVDLVVGTHRLLSKDVRFADLGLLIIDEEHRFGASHKEHVKKMRTEVDVLTMSATPIPRTLQFSLLGIRDVSSIMTPPKERLPVTTRLISFHIDTIKRGVLAEITRGGQVFFVHDNVKTLSSLADQLQGMFPSLTLGIAHGQLPGNILESVMVDFLNRKIDVLVCTSIIESGIDLPNVNTIFIHNAHRFGLSQIHQMRGRVGRSPRQAHCFLVIPKNKKLTNKALDRLRTIEYHSSLGAGYALALKDLEMRGAGNLFGVEQSGHVFSVGFHLFCKIVESAANERLDRPRSPADMVTSSKVSFDGSALLPESYVTDVSDRLYFYRLLSKATELSEIEDVKNEIEDRFGPLPLQTLNLLDVATIQVKARGFGLKTITIKDGKLSCTFSGLLSKNRLLTITKTLQQKLSSNGGAVHFTTPAGGDLKLSISWKPKNPEECFKIIDYLFDSIHASANFD